MKYLRFGNNCSIHAASTNIYMLQFKWVKVYASAASANSEHNCICVHNKLKAQTKSAHILLEGL